MSRVFAVLAVLALASPAWALPAIPSALKEALNEKEEFSAYVKAFNETKDKCASCHIPKADKKAKGHGLNDFGRAFHDHFDDDAFKEAVKAKEAKETARLFIEAWNKAIVEKNEEGVPFSDILKEGKLPGKNPPPAADDDE